MALRKRFSGIPYYIEERNFNGDLVSREPTQELIEYHNIKEMSFGSERRKRFLALLDTGFQFHVNKKYCIQVSKDPDLKKLLKLCKIEMFTERNSCHNFMKYTYIKGVK